MSEAGKAKIRRKIADAVEKTRKAMAYQSTPKEAATLVSRARVRHGIVHFLADHAKTSGVVACVVLALSFSQKSSPIGIWIGILGACLFVTLLVHENLEGRRRRLTLTGVLGLALCIPFLVFGWWLNEPPLLNVIFKNPSGIFSGTNPRTKVIRISYFREFMVSRTMTHFAAYLSGLGFDIPKNIPPVGVGDTPSFSGPQSTITLDEDGIKDSREVVLAYAQTVFDPLLTHNVVGLASPRTLQRVWIPQIYSAYFSCSYIDTVDGFNGVGWRQFTNDPFFKALWELRSRLTQRVVDHALSYAVPQLLREGNDTSVSPDFDSYFGRSIAGGVLYMSSDMQKDYSTVMDIFAKYGIKVIAPHVDVLRNVPVP
jgi:hypothetical protein